jgi:predicted lipase
MFPTYLLTCTGHSLGGALATLTVASFAAYDGMLRVITFGQPRVGDIEFSSDLSVMLDVYRVVNYLDMIPHLPPLGKYKHST